MATFQFDFVGPERTLYSGEVEAVQIPGTEGDMTVLPGHAPVLTSLRVGVIVVNESGQGKGKRIYVQGGFADIGPERVTVLAERAAPVEEVDAGTLDKEIEEAQMQRDATEDLEKREQIAAHIVELQEAKKSLDF